MGLVLFFDSLVNRYPSKWAQLVFQLNLVKNVAFKTAIEKVQNGEEGILAIAERKFLQLLLFPGAKTCFKILENDKMSFTTRFKKRGRFNSIEAPPWYLELRFIVPTSNQCESFFFVAKYAIGSRRAGALRPNIES